jgi:hypothetical protein
VYLLWIDMKITKVSSVGLSVDWYKVSAVLVRSSTTGQPQKHSAWSCNMNRKSATLNLTIYIN